MVAVKKTEKSLVVSSDNTNSLKLSVTSSSGKELSENSSTPRTPKTPNMSPRNSPKTEEKNSMDAPASPLGTPKTAGRAKRRKSAVSLGKLTGKLEK